MKPAKLATVKLSDFDPDSRLTAAEAAAAIGVTTQTIRTWRITGQVPAEKKKGKPNTYRVGDLQDFLTIRAIETATRRAQAHAADRQLAACGYQDVPIPLPARYPLQ